MHRSSEHHRPRVVSALIETFGFSPWLATLLALFMFVLGAAAVVWLVLSAPPRKVTITTGPAGSSFQRNADAYKKNLADNGFTLEIVSSGGSLDNLKRLQSPTSGVDIGFVQGGLVTEPPPDLVSLGSVAYQPLLILYRGDATITRLSELAGKRIGVGEPGSGTHALATALLEANEITGAPTTLVQQAATAAGNDLLEGKLDAVFLMGDSAPIQTVRTLVRTPGVQLFSFTQADAYVRRFPYLNKIVLPQGSIDLAKNLPAKDIVLVGPTVELVARKGLNSTVCDAVIAAAQEVHGKASVIQRRDEFPAPLKRDFNLSPDALRYYKSGKGFVYDLVHSFWLSSLVNRLAVAIVPMILLLIPAVRFLPIAYKWSVQLRIYRCYRPLLRLERDMQMPLSGERAQELLGRLDEIEQDVNALKVPASFADQFYALRGHVVFVRNRLKSAVAANV
jgi:TRAP-type uncharacterized transport system substrate-binding protein